MIVNYGPNNEFTEDVDLEELEAAESIFDNVMEKGGKDNGHKSQA